MPAISDIVQGFSGFNAYEQGDDVTIGGVLHNVWQSTGAGSTAFFTPPFETYQIVQKLVLP